MENYQDKIPGKILIHIPFHYVEDRRKYLEQLLDNFKTYKFTEVNIVIDTNSEDTKKLISVPLFFNNGKIEYVVHKNLEDPFLLTWQHRGEMLSKIDDYDFFMYVEDDILVPWKVVSCWFEDTLNIYPEGHVRGFLRVEKNTDGDLVATDIIERFAPRPIKIIGNKKYFAPPRPYHAFWIYTKEQMMEFIYLKSWKDGNHEKWGIRERAAAGMMWDEQNKCRILIPLGEKNNVLEETLVYHLPNSYALDKNSQFGKIPVRNIFCGKVEFFVRKILKKLHSYPFFW
jgi:hypothetical protein